MLVSDTRASGAAASMKAGSGREVTWNDIVGPVEPFLQAVHAELSEQVRAFDEDIAAYAAYALGGQGKQLRPALVALSGGATGTAGGLHIRAAVTIEMVHLATLVHDDVMDEASMRRSRPTVAARWGNETAVLLGDCLFAQALKLAAGFSTTEICRAVAAAANTVCAGEILQNKRGNPARFGRPDYIKILQMKTGELFAVSCDMGAYLSGATPAQRTQLREYGMAMGTAYQLFDDCLDLFGTEDSAGKSLGTDLAKGKVTLPVLVLLERIEASERELVEGWLRQWRGEYLGPLRERLEAFDVLAESRRLTEAYLDSARQRLEAFASCDGGGGLRQLTEYLSQAMERLGGEGGGMGGARDE